MAQRGAPTGGGGPPRRPPGSDAPWLTLDDAIAMNSLPSVSAAAATLQSGFAVNYGDDSSQSQVLGVTLSVDHRAVDGATAARWLQGLRLRLESPETHA